MKFTDLLRDRARSRRRLPWPPATTSAAPRRRTAAPNSHRAADPDRDQTYFLFATTREQLDFLRFPLGGMRKSRTCARRLRARPAGRRQARQPGHLLRPRRQILRRRRKAAPRRGRARRHRPHRRPRHGPPRRRHPLHHRPTPRPRRRHRRTAVRREARRAQQTRHRRPARSAAHARPRRSANATGSAKARSRMPAQRERPHSPASAPPARPSPAA